MTDDRSERYAAALYERDYGADPPMCPKGSDGWGGLKSSYMAVADEERESMHTQHCMDAGEEVARLADENARLRAELVAIGLGTGAPWDVIREPRAAA